MTSSSAVKGSITELYPYQSFLMAWRMVTYYSLILISVLRAMERMMEREGWRENDGERMMEREGSDLSGEGDAWLSLQEVGLALR